MECVHFSLATTVSTFLYLMSQVLTGLNYFTFTYLNDVLIFSKSWEEHLEHLNVVFNRFKSAGLKIKLSKCQFFKTQLHYLGPRYQQMNYNHYLEKLDAIKKLAPAKNIDKACQILGLLGYYWSFAPAFADITILITNLLKKNVPFNWLYKCQAALDYLKEFFVANQHYDFLTLIKIIYYILMLQTMLTLLLELEVFLFHRTC